jgi:hypothetical protein
MHTVDMLERLLAACRAAGYSIRQEWLGGDGGGVCEIKGQKCVFVDLALPPDEQLERLQQDLVAAGVTLSASITQPVTQASLRRSA